MKLQISKRLEAVLLVLHLNKTQKPSTFFFLFLPGSNCFLLQESWQIDRLVTLTLVCRFMSALNQTPMSSASQTNTSEGCVAMRSEVAHPTCHRSAPVLLLLFRSCLASNPLWLVNLFVTFISCFMMWKCIVFWVFFIYLFVTLQAAWWLAAFCGSTMLLWRHDNFYHPAAYILLREPAFLCVFIHLLLTAGQVSSMLLFLICQKKMTCFICLPFASQ